MLDVASFVQTLFLMNVPGSPAWLVQRDSPKQSDLCCRPEDSRRWDECHRHAWSSCDSLWPVCPYAYEVPRLDEGEIIVDADAWRSAKRRGRFAPIEPADSSATDCFAASGPKGVFLQHSSDACLCLLQKVPFLWACSAPYCVCWRLQARLVDTGAVQQQQTKTLPDGAGRRDLTFESFGFSTRRYCVTPSMNGLSEGDQACFGGRLARLPWWRSVLPRIVPCDRGFTAVDARIEISFFDLRREFRRWPWCMESAAYRCGRAQRNRLLRLPAM